MFTDNIGLTTEYNYTPTSSVTGHDFQLVHLNEILDFSELHIWHEKSPNIVAQSVGVQFIGLQ